eukprot:CAMPEP_0182585468 /NCGR_PEP_ID=MMETSP1324-20130603/60419_1 /TAXON_ID=236786 /ORGANISM="Florenciella sp., Strain RCC1587" /LENGTH=39 /DNA_ID= /DNA_START= /DNA_END= /DNA_ORIENTATION=
MTRDDDEGREAAGTSTGPAFRPTRRPHPRLDLTHAPHPR